MIIGKLDGKTLLINLDQSKAFDRIDYDFLEAVLSATRFELNFDCWTRLLYMSLAVWNDLGSSLLAAEDIL